jgi:hypothetical protein
MNNSKFTDYNILAREDGKTSYLMVGMERVFQHIRKGEEFEQRFGSLDDVVNAIMETVEDNKVPNIHSTFRAYTKTDSSRKPPTDQAGVDREVVEHLPEGIRPYTYHRMPGSNVMTVSESGALVAYRTIERELPYLVAVLNEALEARRRGEKFDAVQHRSMRDALPPISY